ncbi:MAG: hypothetical protein NTV32_08885 [Gammaproteobacteria bacterium]|nr:hypothetical protein [Gammaproteobacteria bacterium]
MNTHHSSEKKLTWLFVIACLSFIPTLFIGYVGEEGLYTISSYEMVYSHHYLTPLFLGGVYWRPPLFNWLIISIAQCLGWTHMLIASRLVTALATLGTSFLLLHLSRVLFKNKPLSYLIAAIYLTSDAGLYHGWIAYADPLYTFLGFAAVTCLWLSILQNRLIYFIASLFFLSAAYLTKALTVYAFYFSMLAGLAWYYKAQRRIALSPTRLILLALALSLPFLWAKITHNQNGEGMLNDIVQKLSISPESTPSFSNYLLNAGLFLLAFFYKLFPISFLFFYFLIQKRFAEYRHFRGAREALFALTMAGLNFIPYCLSPETHEPRYIMMIYPFVSLFLGVFFWNLNQLKPVILWIAGLLLIKGIVICIGLPIYNIEYRGDYSKTAMMILNKTKNTPLYSIDGSATGESVLAFMDLQHAPRPPITENIPTTGPYFVLRTLDQAKTCANEHFVETYPSAKSNSPVYLFSCPYSPPIKWTYSSGKF